MRFPLLRSAVDLAALVDEIGFLPLFQCGIPGFSVDECTPAELWFQDGVDGPWEWKGPVIEQSGCAYGKLLRSKAAFVSREWYPELANWRRRGLDFDERYALGALSNDEKKVCDALRTRRAIPSKELRRQVGFAKSSRFDAVLTRLQMQCYVTTVDFYYEHDSSGRPYGWGVARYAAPEIHMGDDFCDLVYDCPPEESHRRILAHLQKLLPDVTEKALLRLIG